MVRDVIEEERCCTGAWQTGYYNNEDGCVYHELCIQFQSFPPHLPLSIPLLRFGSLHYLHLRPTSGGPGPHFETLGLAVAACSRTSEHFGVCLCLYHLKPLCYLLQMRPGLVIVGKWSVEAKRHFTIHSFSSTGPGEDHPPLLPTFLVCRVFFIFLLFFCLSAPQDKSERNSIFSQPSFLQPCAHLSMFFLDQWISFTGH